jgi:hypothetical protein
MSEVASTSLTAASYTKAIDTGVSAFVAQNTGKNTMYVVFTTGSAPAASVVGLIVQPGETFTRSYGTGHVYAKGVKSATRITVCS